MTLNPSRSSLAAAILAGLLVCSACGKKTVAQAPLGADTTAEPDKVLYERAMADMKSGHEEVARLGLNTLLNTYPDSEFLAKAKLAIADSYYREGTTDGLAQAVAQYKDFITFFPYLDEASYAQYRVAMAHFRQMEKPDRDQTQVQLAEQEFQNYLLNYPKGPQAAEIEQHLREVQEVLAEADFRVAKYYYDKGSFHASAARFTEIADRYPLYSRADDALWMLAESAEKYEVLKHFAADYYKRIVRDYPLSDHVQEAKARLEKAGVPIPQPNPEALARAEAERQHEKEKPGFVRRSLGILKQGPDVSNAAHSGPPQMNPPGDQGGETLSGGTGNDIVVGTAGSEGGAQTGGTGAGGSAPVRTVTAGGSDANTNNSSGDDPNSSASGPKQPTLVDELPNHTDVAPPKKKSPEESSSKKKKGIWKIIPF
ncbi:MAG TPA: outer membrane protein assembly factor BamD [Candidatus Acidoferrales bacterium]|nr:outer membrane protein assembly factor BamD [Candidatus Acidoferrales bacterium]